MHIKLKIENQELRKRYEKHGTFHDGDSGLDLFFPSGFTLKAGDTTCIDLGVACEASVECGCKIEHPTSFLVLPRSSISKTPLRLANSIGLIDGGYRGTIKAVIDNIKDYDYTVHAGDRLFQIVAPDCKPISFDLVDELSSSTRGEGGYGSTGK